MKVCIFTHTFPRFSGDVAAPFMDGVATGIAKVGNEVFVLTPYSPKFKSNLKKEYRVVTYRYVFPDFLHRLGYSETLADDKSLRLLMYFLSPLMFAFGFFALIRLVLREKIELVNAHWILPNGFIASVVSKIIGVPVVSSLPGSDVYMAEKNLLFRVMAIFAAKTSKAVTSNSPQLLEDLGRITGISRNKMYSIIYGVDPGVFRPVRNSSLRLKKEIGIDSKSIVVLGVGRLVAKKGFDYLVGAAPKLVSYSKDVKFVIIGDGDRRCELEKQVSRLGVRDSFIFVGSISYVDLVNYYNLCDIFVLPSVRDEGGNLDDQSVSVVEAMSCGKPVVTTDFPGYRIVVKNGENGYLIREASIKDIESVLGKLIADKRLRERMGERSRELVLSGFSWDSVGGQYTRLFERVKD